ncbi:hypothetical protein KIPB_014810, partial [Kipferlia bialata]
LVPSYMASPVNDSLYTLDMLLSCLDLLPSAAREILVSLTVLVMQNSISDT